MGVFRIYVEKKDKYNVRAKELFTEITDHLQVKDLESVRYIERYDMEGLSKETYEKALNTIFADKEIDNVYTDIDNIEGRVFAESLLSGQFDQQANYFMEYIDLIKEDDKEPKVKVARLYILEGNISDKDFLAIKKYIINPVEKEEVTLEKYETLKIKHKDPVKVPLVECFISLDEEGLKAYHKDQGLAMSLGDLKYLQNYFKEEDRDPTYTEMKVVDTYWSDHCRHTTFMTELSKIEIEEGDHSKPIVEALKSYRDARKRVYGDEKRPETLMDMATIQVKDLNKEGKIPEVVFSEEVNACTIEQTIEVDGKKEKWLVLFKNETHNHPTEIEPFGGAGTCLGGAIRDPLSGRAYVYQAMRITGSADPREDIEDTLEGKLPQRLITKTAADGYSAYGNEIGIAAGEVKEYYHEGYKAKRMELGAVVSAVESSSVKREVPQPGDIVLMLGGKTGRDGCGGATGSSKEQTLETIDDCSSEVQKGNPKEERKIQRLFRNPNFSKNIKRSNDFGAGGVCVAIGELADGVTIDLDKVPLKYPLDGTEIAISESQERMAIVIDPKDQEIMEKLAGEELVEITKVAQITEEKSLVMSWRGDKIVNISRDFLDSAGIEETREVYIEKPKLVDESQELNKRNILITLASLNVGLQKGLASQFDSTAGAGSVFMPYGGSNQIGKEEGMIAKIPTMKKTDAATYMTHGFDPDLSAASPFHGAMYAVIESAAKLVAMGADYKDAYLSLQEYFERLDEDKVKWGKPAAALLGALTAKQNLELAAIGGKDSMSGSFNELDVPPTLVSFTCLLGSAEKAVSNSFKEENHALMYLKVNKDENNMPDFEEMKKLYDVVIEGAKEGKIHSAGVIGKGGLVATVANMSLGNGIGCEVFDPEVFDLGNAFDAQYTDLLVEIAFDHIEEFLDKGLIHIGETTVQNLINYGGENIYIAEIVDSVNQPLKDVFPVQHMLDEVENEKLKKDIIFNSSKNFKAKEKIEEPRVLIPVFSGTTGEYDMAQAFEKAGGKTNIFVYTNKEDLIREIENSQIIALPGGSPMAMSLVLGDKKVKEAIKDHTENKDGLVIGLGGGFQALVKAGLLPYGTFAENKSGRFMSELMDIKITSNNSPWLVNVSVGDKFLSPLATSMARFIVDEDEINNLIANGQIISQFDNNYIEGLVSKDGRILGQITHNDRLGENILKNVPGEKDLKLFDASIAYYK